MLSALGFTRGVTLLAIFGLGVASLCLVTVGEREFAVISQFGRPVRVESTPGLKLKLPAPFQTVTRFDRVGAESRLGDILFAELGGALGGAPFAAFVSTAPGEYRAEAVLAGMTRHYRELAGRDYGIDVVDVRLRRLDFPDQNRASVFARMKSERVRISMQYRSEGEEEGLKIRATAEKAKSGVLGEAYKLSQKIRGEGEAGAAKIYGESLSRAPDFYRFVRSIDAMKKSVDKDTTIVLPVDSDLFRLLRDSRFRFPED